MAGLEAVRIEGGAGRVVLRGVMDAVCPLTGLVDRYEVMVEYEPGPEGLYVEAYSFARFLESLRDRREYQERLTRMIAEEVCRAVRPRRLRVVLRGVHGSVEVESEASMECS